MLPPQLRPWSFHVWLADEAALAGGCGGFGKGNFTELFKGIEDYERTLAI